MPRKSPVLVPLATFAKERNRSKFALEGFTESVANEVIPDWNIRFMILEPAGTSTEFAKGIMIDGALHPAYDVPNGPTRQLTAYVKDPEMAKSWADPNVVAEVVFEVVGRSDMPLRLVTGSDGYDLMVNVEDNRKKELERWAEVSRSCSSVQQSEGVAWLKK